ncbi:hypothetical protein GCM10022226_54750 [Sphaerisporangium flaviroseum]|uniref:Uncharacterized protein n=1 Tax=Sphaerisporangium flaviroseum TaxID=509199 RepID=A0ABP7IU17_9ACTN
MASADWILGSAVFMVVSSGDVGDRLGTSVDLAGVTGNQSKSTDKWNTVVWQQALRGNHADALGLSPITV